MPRKGIFFQDEDSARLTRMQATTRGRSPSSVVDLALQVLEDNVNAVRAGTIEHIAKDGTVNNYDPLLQRA